MLSWEIRVYRTYIQSAYRFSYPIVNLLIKVKSIILQLKFNESPLAVTSFFICCKKIIARLLNLFVASFFHIFKKLII